MIVVRSRLRPACIEPAAGCRCWCRRRRRRADDPVRFAVTGEDLANVLRAGLRAL